MRLRHLALCVALAGCGAAVAPRTPAGPPVPAPAADSCGAAPYAPLVGQDATALERVLILRQVRLLRPGEPVAAEVRPARITFEIDGAGRIARLSCG